MAKTINDKYIVIKTDDVEKHLSPDEKQALSMACRVINYCRSKEGKGENNYYVCNTDEPYAEKVLQVILDGEDEKNGIFPQPLTLEELPEIIEPVWIRHNDGVGHWGYPFVGGVLMFGTSSIKSYEDYGKRWEAFRSKIDK